MSTDSARYANLHTVVSALLWAFDPGEMGSTVFAPADEYDAPARRLISEIARLDDAALIAAAIRGHYVDAPAQLCDAIAAAVRLFR